MNTHQFSISTDYLNDHLERLYDTEDGTRFTHVDVLHAIEHNEPTDGREPITIIRQGKKTTTIAADLTAIIELYTDASYQHEIGMEEAWTRPHAMMAKRVMASMRKQLDIPAQVISEWK